MSFRDDVKAALAGSGLGVFDSWDAFWAACPLNREFLVQHDSTGTEYRSPEMDPGFYQFRFFSGDSIGLVWYQDGVPVTGSVFRLIAPSVVEQTLRLGARPRAAGMRRMLWDIGIRTIMFKVRTASVRQRKEIQDRETNEGNTVVTRPLDEHYTEYRILLQGKPEWKDYDYSDPPAKV